MHFVTKKSIKLHNGSKPIVKGQYSFRLEPGRHEVVEINNPWHLSPDMGQWYVLPGTKIGMTRIGWESHGAIFEEN